MGRLSVSLAYFTSQNTFAYLCGVVTKISKKSLVIPTYSNEHKKLYQNYCHRGLLHPDYPVAVSQLLPYNMYTYFTQQRKQILI